MDWERRRVLGVLGTSATVGLSSCLRFSDASDVVAETGARSIQSLDVTDRPDATEELLSQLPESQAARLIASDSHRADEFGHGVALSGDGSTALVSVPGQQSDAVEVFARNRTNWRRQTRLEPDDEHRGSGFGRAVALSSDGTTALVGAPASQTEHGDVAGSVSVFTRQRIPDNADWQRRTTLVPGAGSSGEAFGTSVALSGDGTIALVGTSTSSGDVRTGYLFAARGSFWTERARLTAPEGSSLGRLGRSVALTADGSTALLSARDDTLAYVFSGDDRWDLTATLRADVADGSDADRPVALAADGSVAVVGTPQAGANGVLGRGAVHIFVHGRDGWVRRGPLVLSDAESLDRLGGAVAVGANGLVVLAGAPGESTPNGTKSGAVYAFVRQRDGWYRQRTLVAEDGGGLDRFSPVALSGDGTTALVGAPGANPTGLRRRGAAYVFN